MTLETAQFRRWQTACHEAGHVIAAGALLGNKTASAVVLPSGGLARIGTPEVLRTFDEASAVAAGRHAEHLAGAVPPPAEPPRPLALVRPDAPPGESNFAALDAAARTNATDEQVVAAWCVRGCPDDPARWQRRYVWVQQAAEYFIAQHAKEIIEFARRLYATGHATLSQEKVS